MVKPSVKTHSFKNHPLYIQKSLHVDNPFYGPKPQYQRAEVPPGGDCETIGDWATDDAGVWDETAGAARVGSASLEMTQTGAVADSSIYLLLAGPVDLSWAKFVGFWFKGKNGVTYAANDIYFYIFTKSGNYACANCARYVDPFGVFTEPGTAVWHYAEIDLADFIISSGYEGDKLDEVWGVGFCAHGLATTETMMIDQIEFYTVGTGKGPARGLIMSAPLYDDIHAERGYGLAWNEYSGRVDVSAISDYAFAGICTGNPSRTRLTADVAQNATTVYVLDASLLELGKATIGDNTNSEERTISAIDRAANTLTIDAITQVAGYTVARNAYICMEGNEEGTIRVDFLVDGIVNVEANEIVNQGYGAKCLGTGDALTVNEDNANEEGMTIGKCMVTCAAEEDFPIKLMTDARTA